MSTFPQIRCQLSSTSSRWFPIYTKVNQEKQVAEGLRRRNIEFFLPLYRTLRRRSDRRVTLSLPLFPGYLFVYIDWQERRRVLEVPRVVRMLGGDLTLGASLETELEPLRKGLSGEVDAEPHQYLTTGCRVRVVGGPFEGMEGILCSRKSGTRVAISITAIMRSFTVEVSERDIERI